ncbi:MAG TPA: RsmE family RNA methyltransferase [Candidatus Dormibacteraeota bacterium]|nr:RsmE family RNA methyltransferase [Candidatus Dormibacteraeota bacterium]
MRRRFFVEKFDTQSATLQGETAEHLGRVLRAEPGQLCELSDGSSVWLGRVERVAISKRGDSRIDFALIEPIAVRESRLRIILLVALVKFDRFEWCLEKATELGAAEIIPLAAARSDKPLIAAAEKRRARWEKILIESSQQSRRLRPPILRFDERVQGGHVDGDAAWKPQAAFSGCVAGCQIILSERPDAPLLNGVLRRTENSEEWRRQQSAALAIGPEGGWTDEELASARAHGFAEASLGENILRTETAVTAAMAILSFALG